MTIGATDTLARFFTVDFGPLATLRGLALTALEFAPPVKTALARQMMFGQRN
jgi:2-octaprenyl-6-methoxyphenol hydroxylase